MADWTAIAKTYDALKAGSIDGTDTFPHDKAVFSAMNAKYKPNKDVIGKPENTIFVGRLSLNSDEETVENYFSKYGKIKRFRLVRDIVTGYSKGYAFIEYFDENAAYRSQKHLDKTLLDEKEVYVDFECERTLPGWIPRRLGGGIGGKKESGQLRFGGKNRPFRKPFNVENMAAPEGKTFRDRLRAVERGHSGRQERDWGRENREDRSRRDSYREHSTSRSRYSDRRSRSRERGSEGRSHRSRSQSRKRSRSRERKRRD